MSMRMLIDARHPEETRVAVAKGNRIEEFDFESTEHKQLKGNIYLAKVTRVEPSLQAAFIEYGGNRHGFLAFSEIHPDYYQIPKADRDALLREEAEHAAEEERLRAEADDYDGADDDGFEPRAGDGYGDDDHDHDHESDGEHDEVGTGSSRSPVDESAVNEVRKKRQALRRRYKIQDVIQRRQVLLVQVVKEERGNKGAALTTYLSLAGRYCVLMPNTSHGGGISRKISNGADRKRLKSIMSDLNLPGSMGLIVRTAGLSRTKTEIKRDFDYLARLWDEVRERTLTSSAPALIYRDSDLIKRAIRDLYNREIDEVCVEGEEGYKAARGFMKLLMPSHVRRVKQYAEATPIFQRFGVEDQLSAMYQPVVQLKSGGYLVINPTEALVSIDINSGRSTREHNIEQTAFSTNIEAAHEIARQLRLRDMAGLVVIDFIDMEQSGHVRKVEKAMKDALKNDRARIQVGRISSFGLMEMSRQRLRTGVLEASTKACPHCEGTGLMRTASSAGLSALRMLEEEAARGRGDRLVLRAGREAAIYVLNKKRAELAEVESRYGVTVEIMIDESFEGARMSVESSGPRPTARPAPVLVADEDDGFDDVAGDDEDIVEDEDEDEGDGEARESGRGRRDARERGDGEDDDRSGRRRRRRRRGGRGRRPLRDDEQGEHGDAASDDRADDRQADDRHDEDAEPAARDSAERDGDGESGGEGSRRRRRRGGRGRRGRDGRDGGSNPEGTDADRADAAEPALEAPGEMAAPEPASAPEPVADEEKPKTRRRPRARKADAEAEAPAEVAVSAPAPEPATDEEAAKPKRRSRARKVAEAPAAAEPAAETVAAPEAEAPAAPKRRSRAKAKPAAERETAAPATDAAPEAETAADPDATASEAAPATGDDGDGSPRRGWWQRTFG